MAKLTGTDLRGFSYFLAVADEQSLAAAAKRLHMAQPPLSVQIRKLEDRVGVALFERSSHGMRLTDAGRALYARAKDAVQLAQDGFDAAAAIGSGRRGTLKVGLMHSLCYAFLPRIVEALHQRLPEADFHFEEMDAPAVREELQERRIHVAIGLPPQAQDGMACVACGRLRYEAAVPDSVFPDAATPLSLDRFTAEPLILLPTAPQAQATSGVLQMLRQRGYHPQVAYRVQTVHGALALVKAGMGVAVLPESVRAMLPAGVALRPLQDFDHSLEVAASWLDGQPDQALIREFVEVVQPMFAEPASRIH
ncbi:LysR family transcriptional regulator [Acidovorax sp.]|uniref:LysR family transcriptional regulator n=1 Tax=Acidovorax sp. TaxID=1872122 RepID=UPI002ACD72D5|nr:LysR family transcriptional regulator [Acidovorax sp.]MDZ7862988.1 LysR family transcriptional regulator [Acidovorax sp.]